VHRYRVYGLLLESELELPELVEARAGAGEPDVEARAGAGEPDVAARAGAGEPDVQLRYGRVELGAPPEPDAQSWLETAADPVRTRSVFEAIARFEVRAGALVLVDPEPEVDPRLVRHALLGPVLAQLLWQRELYTLHASVVRVGGRSAAFVGASGAGKSTTAAALTARGHPLVCDDVAALCWRDQPLRVLPGFPRIRLYADSLRGLGGAPDAHPLVHGLIDKRLTPVPAFIEQAQPLDRIYVLEAAEQLEAERLAARFAALELMKHAYNAYQFAPVVGFAQHLQMAARVAGAVPVFRLRRPKDLARLTELVDFIESHLQT
jgi:hypothetical protein